jgi:hypothetical protein
VSTNSCIRAAFAAMALGLFAIAGCSDNRDAGRGAGGGAGAGSTGTETSDSGVGRTGPRRRTMPVAALRGPAAAVPARVRTRGEPGRAPARPAGPEPVVPAQVAPAEPARPDQDQDQVPARSDAKTRERWGAIDTPRRSPPPAGCHGAGRPVAPAAGSIRSPTNCPTLRPRVIVDANDGLGESAEAAVPRSDLAFIRALRRRRFGRPTAPRPSVSTITRGDPSCGNSGPGSARHPGPTESCGFPCHSPAVACSAPPRASRGHRPEARKRSTSRRASGARPPASTASSAPQARLTSPPRPPWHWRGSRSS